MMLRLLVVVLLLANLGYFAWTRGGLAVFGTEPARFSEREPQRLTQQVRPQMLQIRKDEPPKP
ncbi:sporulation protein [Variovorax sp. J22P240]|uniref:sporulation protein n=1 Tax=unclassified Variovorax TaxID=663243 RepID=UPI002576A071|nr:MULTISPECIES: sporulation protein [unclassified Variovorax]MDL9999093.1 sporulation protein [Variovorax sp. J22P240]MDM0052662.1 sporulation protein [Variovorax sp. J22R115]